MNGRSATTLGMTTTIVGLLGVGTASATAQCLANELAKVTASDAAHGDHFGESVSISPDGIGVALIGAHADDDAGILSGSAYVYRFDPERSEWIEEQKLVASDAATGDRFGTSVSIRGDVSVIGAPLDDDACEDNPFCGSGSAYVFRYNGSSWIEDQKLLASDAYIGDAFGWAVAIEGDVIVIGASHSNGAGQSSGSAYVFRFDPDTSNWVQEAKLRASDAAAWDQFGFAVSISGDVVLIGAPFEEDVPSDSGSAYVFVKPEGGWVDMTETAKLTASDAAAFDKFGISVSISGGVALIGAWKDNDAGSQSGSAYVFRYDSERSLWVQEQKLVGSDLDEGDGFGFAVALSDNVALIGARGHDDGGFGSGSAYVFRFDGSTWTEDAKLLASDPAAIDGFGFAVAISADGQAVIGALQDDDACPGNPDCNSGSAYIFGGLSDCNNNGELDLCDIADGFSSDENNNGIPDECESPPCPWDLDNNGTVGVPDLLELLASWGQCKDCPADFDCNGNVGVSDLLALLANWGECP